MKAYRGLSALRYTLRPEVKGNNMKLIQVIHKKTGTKYIYECEVCGSTLAADTEILKCPTCRIWAEVVAKKMEESNERENGLEQSK